MDDEVFYETAFEELREERVSEPVWTQALATAHGNEVLARAAYVELRARELRAEELRAEELKTERDRPHPERQQPIGRPEAQRRGRSLGMALGFSLASILSLLALASLVITFSSGDMSPLSSAIQLTAVAIAVLSAWFGIHPMRRRDEEPRHAEDSDHDGMSAGSEEGRKPMFWVVATVAGIAVTVGAFWYFRDLSPLVVFVALSGFAFMVGAAVGVWRAMN